MAGKKKKDKPPKPATRQPRTRPRLPMPALKAAATLAVAAAALAGLYALRGGLLASPAYAQVLARVELADLPGWMPADIAAEVAADVQSVADGRSVFEGGLARDVYRRAAANPWTAAVKRVTKQGDGTVLVQAEYRRPFAIVGSPALPASGRVVVGPDAGVLPLPAHRIKPNALIAIGGVGGTPPEPGLKWDSPELADALRWLKLIRPKPWKAEITTLSVRRMGDLIELVMTAQVGRGRPTTIVVGRLPSGDDYCVSPQRKLAYLDKYYSDRARRLAGVDAELDLRFDQLHVEPY